MSTNDVQRYKGLFDDLFPSKDTPLPDADLVKLGLIWDKIEHFIEQDIKDGFQLRDLYSLIIAVMNGLELGFAGVSGVQLKKYAIYLVNKLISELTERNIIPSEVSFLLSMIPLGTIIDLIASIGRKSSLVNNVYKTHAEERLDSPEWITRNWTHRV